METKRPLNLGTLFCVCVLCLCFSGVAAATSYSFVEEWGTTGSGDGQLRLPAGVALDSRGNVVVTEEGNHRIQKFDSEGNFLRKWGSEGSGDGQFDSPERIAMDSSGNLFITDFFNARVQVFTSSGNFLRKWGSFGSGDRQFNEPYGIAVDSEGNVFVSDTRNHRIQIFDSSGSFLGKWGSEGSADGQFRLPLGIAVDSEGNVFVADRENDRIQKFRRDPDIRISGPADSATVDWNSRSRVNYQVWLSADLVDWITAGGIQTGSKSGINFWTDDGIHDLGHPSGARRRYYRVETLP